MRKILAASLTLALLVVPATALAKPPTRSHARQYQRAYHAVAAKFGHRAPGRNIVRDGMARRRTSDADVVRSLGVLRRMLAPPPAPVTSGHFSSSKPTLTSLGHTQGTYSSTVSGVCGGVTPYPGGGRCWAIPYSIVLCESGGSYTAHNPSGASGAYQLMIGGGGSQSSQDQAAARLWNGGRGAGNWVCK